MASPTAEEKQVAVLFLLDMIDEVHHLICSSDGAAFVRTITNHSIHIKAQVIERTSTILMSIFNILGAVDQIHYIFPIKPFRILGQGGLAHIDSGT